jgi:hypothetical protein
MDTEWQKPCHECNTLINLIYLIFLSECEGSAVRACMAWLSLSGSGAGAGPIDPERKRLEPDPLTPALSQRERVRTGYDEIKISSYRINSCRHGSGNVTKANSRSPQIAAQKGTAGLMASGKEGDRTMRTTPVYGGILLWRAIGAAGKRHRRSVVSRCIDAEPPAGPPPRLLPPFSGMAVNSIDRRNRLNRLSPAAMHSRLGNTAGPCYRIYSGYFRRAPPSQVKPCANCSG